MKLPSFFFPNPDEKLKEPTPKKSLFGFLKKLKGEKEVDEDKKKKSNKRAIIAFVVFATICIIFIVYSSSKLQDAGRQTNKPQPVIEVTLEEEVDYYVNRTLMKKEDIVKILVNNGYKEEDIRIALDNAKTDWDARQKEMEETEQQNELIYQEYLKKEEEEERKKEEEEKRINNMQNVIEKNTDIKYPQSFCIAQCLNRYEVYNIKTAKRTTSTTLVVTTDNGILELDISYGITRSIVNKSDNKQIFDGEKLTEKLEDGVIKENINRDNISMITELGISEFTAKNVNNRLRNSGLYSIKDAFKTSKDDSDELTAILITNSFMMYNIKIKDDKLQVVTNMYTGQNIYEIQNKDGIDNISLL